MSLGVGSALAERLLREGTTALALAFVPLALAAVGAGRHAMGRAALSFIPGHSLVATDLIYKNGTIIGPMPMWRRPERSFI